MKDEAQHRCNECNQLINRHGDGHANDCETGKRLAQALSELIEAAEKMVRERSDDDR